MRQLCTIAVLYNAVVLSAGCSYLLWLLCCIVMLKIHVWHLDHGVLCCEWL